MSNINLKQEILNKILPVINSWQDEGIYALSLFVYDENDNPCMPTVTLGYNTNYQLLENKGQSDELELAWNYAYWIQNQEYVFGFEDDTQELIKEWVIENNLPYDEDYFPYATDYDEATQIKIQEITKLFVNELISVVKELHQSGIIKNKFGKAIPVLIHELEYYDRIALQNIEANGYDLVKDFSTFCGYNI